MNVTVFHVDSFCVDGAGGNPAGVVLHADELSHDQKRAISAKVGFSETAFVEQSSVADFKVSFFTPWKKLTCVDTQRLLSVLFYIEIDFVPWGSIHKN